MQNSDIHLTQRTFEVLGSGGFLLTVRTSTVQRVFSPGRHLAAVTSAEETVALVDHYLTHAQKRLALARNGRAEVYEHHTYRHRAGRMLELLRMHFPSRLPQRMTRLPNMRPSIIAESYARRV